jgi:hypothetical protein
MMRCWRLGEGDELYAADGSSTTQTRCGRLRLDDADEMHAADCGSSTQKRCGRLQLDDADEMRPTVETAQRPDAAGQR